MPVAVDYVWAGTTWQVNPTTTLTREVYQANENHDNGNSMMVTLAGTYSLSKRTLAHSELGYLRNCATSNLGLNRGQRSDRDRRPCFRQHVKHQPPLRARPVRYVRRHRCKF
ncbi:hypothetical protein [Paraburkholderia terricola]|uniref:hypothetical protein n=1 Tax=Paraburkholderia terricola TaxID=169427 RepID=UPI0035B517B6